MNLFFEIVFFLFCIQADACQPGKIIADSITSKFIVNTITGENPVRQLAIYLPPGYITSSKRFPVLYLLHGVGDTEETFISDTVLYNNIQDLMNKGIAANKFGEMIIVMPNEKTNWFGSFYTNSTVTGNWEDFTTTELISYIDKNYRTIPASAHRAIAGHSMGGYGAFTLAMKHPDLFSTVYSMNGAFFCFCGELKPANPAVQQFIRATSMEEVLAAQNFIAAGLLNLARAVSPNPLNPPLYLDKPFRIKNSKLIINEPIYKKWEEKDVVQMTTYYKSNLRKLHAIKFDSGTADDSQFIIENNQLLSQKLKQLRIPHEFEEYIGNHNNKLWGLQGRIYNSLLPFVYKNIGN